MITIIIFYYNKLLLIVIKNYSIICFLFALTFGGISFLYFHFSIILLSVARIAYRRNSSTSYDIIVLQRNYSHPLAREPLLTLIPNYCILLRFILKLHASYAKQVPYIKKMVRPHWKIFIANFYKLLFAKHRS